MDWFSIVTQLLPLAFDIKNQIDSGTSFNSVTSIIKNPTLIKAFETVGGQLFPQLKPELHAAAAIVTAFDPNHTKWVQNSLNALVPGANLVVDGQYGPATKAAVIKLQAQLGVTSDGWVGDITSAAIQLALNKIK